MMPVLGFAAVLRVADVGLELGAGHLVAAGLRLALVRARGPTTARSGCQSAVLYWPSLPMPV